KFPSADRSLGTTMKSVGEVMAIGRTFAEALGKAFRALERPGFDLGVGPGWFSLDELATPTEDRLLLVNRALAAGHGVEEVARASGIDPWFVDQVEAIAERAAALRGRTLETLTEGELRAAKQHGISDRRIAGLTGSAEPDVRAARRRLDVLPVFKTVDTCAGEFEARTPYH